MDKHVTSINGMGAITESGGTYTTTGMEANDHMHVSEDFIKNAGVRSVDLGDLLVSEADTPGKKVKVLGGMVYVENSDYTDSSLAEQKYWRVKMSGSEEVTITDNASGNPRIDIICVKIDTTATPDDEATNVASLIAIAGTPAALPSVPATPDYHYKLAEVAVANGFSSILDANITDKRDDVTFQDSAGGWISAGETWTYASSDDPTYTFTITGDKTTKYFPGMRVRLVDSGTQYFIITKVAYSAPDTTITVYGGSDYDLSSGAITSPFYSGIKVPYGFPAEGEKWTEMLSDTSARTQSSPAASTWYNVGSLSLSIPIGKWNILYSGVVGGTAATVVGCGAYVTLSTGNATESNPELTSNVLSAGTETRCPVYKSEQITITSKTTYYLNLQRSTSSTTAITLYGNLGTTKIKAICAYL